MLSCLRDKLRIFGESFENRYMDSLTIEPQTFFHDLKESSEKLQQKTNSV